VNEPIKKALANLKNAERKLKLAFKIEQKTCAHPRVVHANWRHSDWGSAFKAQRLCLCCGLEEDARNSGWGNNDADFRRLKTKGFHKIVSHDDLWDSRFPHADVDNHEGSQS
jgi:hypothetical protein